jgi:foldase protein PrsA
MRISKKLAALGAFFVLLAVLVAGCGGSSSSVGSDSVANVAGNAVSKRAWTHWMFVYAKQEAAQFAQEGETEPVVVPDPPNFENCAKDLKTSASFASATPALLKRDCAQVFQQSNKTILAFLIQGYWYQGLAHKEGLNVSNAEVQSKFKTEINSQYKNPTPAQLKKDLAAYYQESGETRSDLEWQLRAQLAYQKLITHFTKPVTANEISGYYSENPSKFTTPELRDAHVLRVTTKAKAQSAYEQLKSGASWDSVTKKFETGSTASNTGALLTNISEGSTSTLENAASKVVFASKIGQLVAPIKGVYGYYVIQVTKSTPAKKAPFNAATKAEIKKELTTEAGTAAKTKVAAEAKKAFGSRTNCAHGFGIATYCNNYAASKPPALPKTPTTAASGASTTAGSTATSTSSSSGTSKKKKK